MDKMYLVSHDSMDKFFAKAIDVRDPNGKAVYISIQGLMRELLKNSIDCKGFKDKLQKIVEYSNSVIKRHIGYSESIENINLLARQLLDNLTKIDLNRGVDCRINLQLDSLPTWLKDILETGSREAEGLDDARSS